jgi:lipopolysaccharide/colanic/teichoic acid biosynthesis glycosyltransferase
MGKNNKSFVLYKFRTMIPCAEKMQQKYKKQNQANGPVFKIHDDPRFTKIGRVLSHTGLDELPQLWNILLGNMALFGPRPLPVHEADKLLPWQKKRHSIKPGILSPWVLNGYHRRTFNEWMKSDCLYVHDKSLLYDTKLFFQSVGFMATLLYRETAGKEE